MGKNSAHSRLAPSASHRWIVCPGSIALSAQVPEQPDSEYAAEGTAAHDVASFCLLKEINANGCLGETRNGFIVDKEMADAVQVYLDEVRSRLPTKSNLVYDTSVLFVETKFDMAWLHPGLGGSTDAYIVNRARKMLHVLDYKHGVGVIVDPEWNPQAMIYALGALHDLWAAEVVRTKAIVNLLTIIESVEIVIVQPRSFGEEEQVKKWTIATSDLVFWGLHVLKAAAVATEQENAPLRVSKECRFCPALAVCPAQAENALALAQTQFKDPIFPTPDKLTPETIAKIMALSQVFNSWTDEVKAYAQKQMECGMRIPGFKLVQKKSNRVWKDELDAAETLTGLLGEDAFEKKLLSVAKAEKALKPLKAELSPNLWTKPDAGVSIAPETDKRPEVSAPSTLAFLDSADWLQ